MYSFAIYYSVLGVNYDIKVIGLDIGFALRQITSKHNDLGVTKGATRSKSNVYSLMIHMSFGHPP